MTYTPSSSTQPLLDVSGLRLTSRSPAGERLIVSGIDLQVREGETVGIVGESGSGKSMTARALLGLLPRGVRADGRANFQGVDLISASERQLRKLRGNQLTLLPQDPFTMLNPLMRCGDEISQALRSRDGRRLRKRERRREAHRRLAEVGMTDPSIAERYPFQLSGGMRQRVGLAAALAGSPRLLIADEPSTALDVTTQKAVLDELKRLQQARHMALVLITHDLRVAFSTCDRIYVLYAGSVVEMGGASAMDSQPLHPYTLGLLLSEPPADRRLQQLVTIPGSVPLAHDVRDRCPFEPRCRWAGEICRAGSPPLREEGARLTACVRLDDIREEMLQARVLGNAPSPERPRTSVRRDSLVAIRGLEKRFDSTRVLNEVNLTIGANESVGLVGESGSGKTTLARCLLGLEQPSSGEIVIDGIDASDWSRLGAADASKLRRTVQIVFQDPYSSLNSRRTVGATLSEALRVGGPETGDLAAAVGGLLRRVGLPETYARRKPGALSGGERQRVAIARALAVRPKLIVCDEPVSALDVSVQAQVLNLLRELRADLGVSFLFITHDLAVVRQIVDRVYVIYRGDVVESGPAEDVLDNATHEYTERLVSAMPTGHLNDPQRSARQS